MRSRPLSILTVPAALLLLAGCREVPQREPQPRPVPVEVGTVRSETLPAFIEAPGTLQARNRITLSAQVNGFVREVRVREGDTVPAGRLLVLLDAREAESQASAARSSIAEAEAALEEARKSAEAARSTLQGVQSNARLAQQTFERYQKLFEERSVSPQELDEVRARRDGARAEVEAREAMVAASQDRLRQVEARIAQARAHERRADVVVGWTSVQAPAAARVVQRLVDPGAAIFPGSPLLVLESTGRPQVVAHLPTRHVAHLKPGLDVRVRGAASAAWEGRVAEISPASDPAGHTVQFKVDLPADVPMVSGEFVKVDVPAGSRDALLVPRDSIRTTGQLTGIFIADGSSIARLRLVKTAPYDASRLELLSGVDPGERYVVRPGPDLLDGTPLEIRP